MDLDSERQKKTQSSRGFMASHHHSFLLLWLGVLLGLATTQSSACSMCSSNLFSKSCSNISYKFEIIKGKDGYDALNYECVNDAQKIYLDFHKGCNFSSVQVVFIKKCQLPNVSFSEVFMELEIIPEKVSWLIFKNEGLSKDMTLKSWHLDRLDNLKRLELTRNSFISIPADLFKPTPNLENFLFYRNNISIPSLPETLFANAPRLQVILLAYNRLQNISDNMFLFNSNLTRLTLYANTLGELSPKLLANTPEITSLDISDSGIKLTSDTFKNLPKLEKLYLNLNDLESLPKDIFHNCPRLQEVKLQNNRLQTLPSELFQNSKNISIFDIQKNRITKIPSELFRGLENLTTLIMERNSIENIPDGVFADLVNLQRLLLKSNPLQTLPIGSFDHHSKMKELDLRNTSLIDLPDNIFKNCESLERLDLSYNHLSKLKNILPHPITVLQTLNLEGNNLSFSDMTNEPQTIEEMQVVQFSFANQMNLHYLYLQSNKIQTMPHGLRSLKNLRTLDLRNNNIKYLDYNDFLVSSDDDVSLRADGWGNLEIQYFPFRQFVEVQLGGNPLICDCNLYEFAQLLQNKISEEDKNRIHMQVNDKINVKCSLPGDDSIQKLVMIIDISTLICYRKECHPSCTCVTRPHDHMFIMKCIQQGLQTIPTVKPYMPDENYTITLDLRQNYISNLETLQNSEYSNLVNLTVPNNNLKFINASYLPKGLEALDVSGNALTHFSSSLINFLNITNPNLNLGENLWLCDCQMVELYTFLRNPLRKLVNAQAITCDNLKKPLLSLAEEELCPTIQQPIVVIIITTITIFLFLFFVIGTMAVYKYQQNIKVWLFTHKMCLWVVTKEEANSNKKFDAFISYSNKDEEYVSTVLVPGLENGEPKYRVCVTYRDWVPGEYIQNQIDQSIEDSHRTIVILSSNFIENVWGQIEFKTAHSKALKEKGNKIIVIVLGQVPPESEMDEELKLYLSTRTYLQSNHPKFWENLRYAMPHPQEFLLKRQNNKKTENLQMVHTNGKAKS